MNKRKLIGVVVCGGESSRMGYDKCLLDYFGNPQYENATLQLEEFCDEVLISCREDQDHYFPETYYRVFDDPKFGYGPMAALMTIHDQYPEADILFFGCDYPLVTSYIIEELVQAYHKNECTTTLYDGLNDMMQPLIAIYTEDAFREIENVQDGSLLSLLKRIHAMKCEGDTDILQSVDTPVDYLVVKQFISDELIRQEQILPDLFS